MSLGMHAEQRFGVPVNNRLAPVMVTMPSKAATDPAMVRDLLAAGMGVMRINRAHGAGRPLLRSAFCPCREKFIDSPRIRAASCGA